MNAIGITEIGSYIPEYKIDNLKRLEQFGVNERLVREKTGMISLSMKADEEETSDLAVHAVKNLQEKSGIDLDAVQCLAVVTQNPDGHGLPHTAAIVQAKLGLATSCAAFDISLGCSGYVYGLSVLKGVMLANGFSKGLLVTVDPYSKVLNPHDKNTSLLFGDAATATLLEKDGPWQIGLADFGTDGSAADALHINKDRILEMNGRAVFNFSAKTVPASIERALLLNKLTLSDVDKILLHQGSRYIVETIRERLSLEENKAPFLAEQYGNTVSSSIPLMMSEQNFLSNCNILLISGFGVGLSWASNIIYRR